MSIKITSRDIKFFTLGVLAALIFTIIYDWDQFERGFMGEPPHDNIKIENVE